MGHKSIFAFDMNINYHICFNSDLGEQCLTHIRGTVFNPYTKDIKLYFVCFVNMFSVMSEHSHRFLGFNQHNGNVMYLARHQENMSVQYISP